MARYLTQQWLDERRRLWSEMPERPHASARIQYEVTGDRPAQYWVTFVDGRIEASETGRLETPEIVLTFDYADGVQMEKGDIDANDALRQGIIKFAGDMRILMGMFPVIWPSPTGRMSTARLYRGVQERVRGVTEF